MRVNIGRSLTSAIALCLFAILTADGALACNSPLILDLDGDGIYTTGVDKGVQFDLDGDGFNETCGWIDRYEDDAFLWYDLNGNGMVDSGRELFGDATITPEGSTVGNGFEALAYYDRPEFGGNGDRRITADDLIWGSLRLWVDKSYDGLSSAAEIYSLDEKGIESINLRYKRRPQIDGNNNLRAFWSDFLSEGDDGKSKKDIIDVFFRTREP